ncbi:MAG: hypothetical protein R2753_12525 [Chitinophagales bacterium]
MNSENYNGLNEVIISNASKNIRVGVLPDYGGALNRFEVLIDGHYLNLIDGYSSIEETNRHRFKGVCLAPFPNRIKDGKFESNGVSYQLDCNDKFDHAMHGFVYNKEMSYLLYETSIELDDDYDGQISGYPFPFQLQIIYRLKDKGFEQEIQLTNKSNQSIPIGLGWHPYFSDLGIGVDHLKMKMPNAKKVIVDERKIPTGEQIDFNQYEELKPIGNVEVDHCFIVNRKPTPALELNYPKYDFSLSLSIDGPNDKENYIQLYIPKERNAIAIEPMTCAPDAFNNGVGLVTLAPTATYKWTSRWEIENKK